MNQNEQPIVLSTEEVRLAFLHPTLMLHRVTVPSSWQIGTTLWGQEGWMLDPQDDDEMMTRWYEAGVPVIRTAFWHYGYFEVFGMLGLPLPQQVEWQAAETLPHWASRIHLKVLSIEPSPNGYSITVCSESYQELCEHCIRRDTPPTKFNISDDEDSSTPLAFIKIENT